MSAANLPPEIVEEIFKLIHPKLALPTPLSQKTFAALARTSKQFLPFAREWLYCRPLLRASWITWNKADSLAETLNSRNGSLGRLVQSLEGIASVTTFLAKLQRTWPEDHDRSNAWYLKVVGACTNLEELELQLEAQLSGPGTDTEKIEKFRSHLDLLRQTLKSSSSIRTFEIQHQQLDYEQVEMGLRSLSFLKVVNLKLTKISFRPRMAMLEDRNVLKSTKGDLTRHESLGELPSIETLQIQDFDCYRSVRSLIATLSPTLQHLSLLESLRPLKERCPPTFQQYSSRSPSRLYSYDSIWSPNNLITFLNHVASSSPHLESIDLHDAYWFKFSEPPSRRGIMMEDLVSQLCSEESLRELFSKFKSLKSVDLGILPTTEEDGYGLLRQELVERGVEISWKKCRSSMWCAGCQRDHK